MGKVILHLPGQRSQVVGRQMVRDSGSSVVDYFKHPMKPRSELQSFTPVDHEPLQVSIERLVPTQPSIDPERLGMKLAGRIEVIEGPHGLFYLMDGHHRTVTAINAGETTMPATLIGREVKEPGCKCQGLRAHTPGT